jgi:carboxymethylenebutenolidase
MDPKQLVLPAIAPEQEDMLAVWQQHTHAEFALRDADAALATMTDRPSVFLAALGVARVGRDAVRSFYANKFLPSIPPDLEVISLSQTVGADQIVDELVLRFTHTIKVDWLLPGLRPTHRRLEVLGVAVVGFEGGKIAYERLYWDQAALLAQAGAVDHPLALTGIDAAAQLARLMRHGSVCPEDALADA